MPAKATPQNGQETTVSKSKKSARSTPATPPKKTAVRKKAAAAPKPVYAEIVYDALPNPYHAPTPPYVWIDHPQQKEMLHAADYVIRLGIGGADVAELSIDQGPWLSCRATSGYWWYDWRAIAPGEHTLVARIKTYDGAWFRTPERQVYRNY
jgi:hypothetical protein